MLMNRTLVGKLPVEITELIPEVTINTKMNVTFMVLFSLLLWARCQVKIDKGLATLFKIVLTYKAKFATFVYLDVYHVLYKSICSCSPWFYCKEDTHAKTVWALCTETATFYLTGYLSYTTQMRCSFQLQKSGFVLLYGVLIHRLIEYMINIQKNKSSKF